MTDDLSYFWNGLDRDLGGDKIHIFILVILYKESLFTW